MAGSITWEQLRELASYRAERGCAVSLYAGLDPSIVPTPGDLASHTRSLLARAERQLDEQRATLSHAERKALAGDLEHIASWFESEFSREGVRGVAVFAAGLDDLFRPLLLPWSVDDDARIARQLYLAPLVRGVGRGDGAVVAYVGRERGDVYRLSGGRLIPVVDETTDVPGRHDQGGWSQARYERHIETIVDRHLREVADALDRCVRGLGRVRVVLVGPEETRAGFEGLLSSEVRAALLGWAAAEAHVDAPRLGRCSRAGVPVVRTSCSRAGARRLRGTAAPRQGGRRHCRLPLTVVSSSCSCRMEPIGLPTSARRAGGRRLRMGAVRSTVRRCSRPTPVWISPSTRR